MYKGRHSASTTIRNRHFRDSCGTAFLQGRLVYFAEVLVGKKLNVVTETIDITSYFTQLCHFALQMSSTAVKVKGSIIRDEMFCS